VARYECIVCGLIYDENEGWPEDGIAAGTLWADVPDDWLCPDCGVGKADFELIPGSESEATEAHTTSDPEAGETRPLVIVGAGLAGYGLVRELRRRDKEMPITVIAADGGEVYSKPLISTGYTKKLSVAQLAPQSADDFGAQNSCTVMTRATVASIDTAGQTLTLASGETLDYRALVLALGADLIRPPMGGDAADEVMGVNDLDDYQRFQDTLAARGARKVAVIGAGLIGCEFTNDLLNGGFTVEAVDPMGWCLPTLLPEPAGRAVQAALENLGATFHFGPLATEVNHHEGGYRVTLNNGDTIDADAVLSAVGVRPRTALAAEAGLAVGRGIQTNQKLEASAPNVYALGDCAEVAGHVLVYVAPLMAGARALATTLTGEPTDVVYPPMPVTIKTPACAVNVSPAPHGASGSWEISGTAPDITALFKSPDGDLLGFALTGEAVRERPGYTKQLPDILS